ncbi:hypothetical protein [Actinospica robiniae]|uniref:hypothetical protein n=1 Tax=Actinospica robiniae TaxID=304901 RepID=UPI00041C2018|nr:hypothetical protein [Actinospica robiniae]
MADRDGRAYQALGLYAPESGETVVELDNYGAPLPADEQAVALIADIERQWPQPNLSESELAELADQASEIRYLLLSRLAHEGDPPPELFHILPWHDVESVCRSVVGLLRGDPPAPVRALGHLFTPAITQVTGPLEQLHLGLAEADQGLIRVGATALCQGLYLCDVRRLPPSTARAFVRALALIGEANPFLTHIATVTSARLTDTAAVFFSARLTREMTKFAASSGVRFESRQFADDSRLRVTAQVNQAGTLSVAIDYAVPADDLRAQLLASYEAAVFQPVRIITDEGAAWYWVALEVRARRLSGVMSLSAPERFTVQADLGPVGARELAEHTPEVLRPSLWAADNAGKSVWRTAAAALVDHHPVSMAVAAAESEGWR